MMGRLLGLKRTGINFAVPPGKESFVYHAHQREEESIYILSARARPRSTTACTSCARGFHGLPCWHRALPAQLRQGRLYLPVRRRTPEHRDHFDFPGWARMLRRGEQVDVVDIHPERELTPSVRRVHRAD